MEVQLLETNRHSFVKPERQGSLYDETPLLGKFIFISLNIAHLGNEMSKFK